MNFTTFSPNRYTVYVSIIILWLLILGFWQHVNGAEGFQISGYYLGATPEEIGIKVESYLTRDEKFYETEANDVRLFFVRVQGTLRVYRIVKEVAAKQENIKSILEGLKEKYGIPDKQQVKTTSIKSYKGGINVSVKNRAIWNIAESQEFITEIESKRVIYELLEHEPEKIKPSQKPEFKDGEGFIIEGWDPDY